VNTDKSKKPPLIWPEDTEENRKKFFCGLWAIAPGPQIQWEFDRLKALPTKEHEKWWKKWFQRPKKVSESSPEESDEFEKMSDEEVKQHLDAVYFRTPSGDFPAPARKEAFYGIAGRIVKIITDGSELKPEAVVAQSLVVFGNMLGRGLYKYQEARHGTNINVGIIGTTADGAKGGSWRAVQNLSRSIDPKYADSRIGGGHQSGEAIIEEVCDPLCGKDGDGQPILILEGQPDKRFLLVEEELSRIFRLQGRGGSIITQILRLYFPR